MTPEKQIIALSGCWREGTWLKPDKDLPNGMPCNVPDFLHSLDACKPLIEKMAQDKMDFSLQMFWGHNRPMARFYDGKFKDYSVIAQTPESAICECVLKAIGRWEEE